MREAPLVADVLALPEEERLTYALDLIRSLSQPSQHMSLYLTETYRMSPREADLVNYLAKREGRPISKIDLFDACWGPLSEAQIKIVDVLICKARSKLPPGAKIETVWGFGYKAAVGTSAALGSPVIEEGITAKPRPASDRSARNGERWAPYEDAELARMADNHSNLRSMAEETGRSERAVRDRLKVVRPLYRVPRN